MPEQKTNFMSQLDRWSDEKIVFPLLEAAREFHDLRGYEAPDKERDKELQRLIETVKKNIREKVLESYRNGQAAKSAR